MRYETLFLALAAGLINCESSRFDLALNLVEEAFEGLEFRKQRVPGHSSIGARTLKSQSLTLVEWIEQLHRQGLYRAGTPGLIPSKPHEKLSKMQSDAFSGGNVRSLVVEFASGRALYALQIENSSPHLMSVEEFGKWIANQPSPEALWAPILGEINEFNQMNGLETVLPEEIDGYFSSSVGAHVFSVIGDRWLDVAQSAATRAGFELAITEAQELFFDRGDREEQIHLMLGGSADEFMPFEELLHLNGSATSEELLRLFDSQTYPDLVWNQIGQSLVGIREMEDGGALDEIKHAVQMLSSEKIEFFGNSLITRMQNACRSGRTPVVITEEFQGRLRTHIDSLTDEQRAGYVPTSLRLHFAPNREPWQHFCFNEIGPFNDQLNSDLEQTIAEMQKVLRQAYAFASRVGSSYTQAFALANFVLSKEASALFESENGFEEIQVLMSKQGYSEDAQKLLEDETGVILVLKGLGYSPMQLSALCASAMADVFGGMGSWSDIYFEDPSDQKEYEEISEALFEALQALQSDSLSAVADT